MTLTHLDRAARTLPSARHAGAGGGGQWLGVRAGGPRRAQPVGGRAAGATIISASPGATTCSRCICPVAFDMRISEGVPRQIADLLMYVNAQLWIGHFDLWPEDGTIIFRQC